MENYNFNVADITAKCIKWIQEWFEFNGKDCNAYIGISGGKDSTICAALLKEALGGNRVYGVAMPDSYQDTNDAKDICKFLGINYVYAPIGNICDEFAKFNVSPYAEMNIPPRVRMTMLYALSQSNNGRVCGTGNLSEWYLLYFTDFGDNGCDFAPIKSLTVTEVKEIGKYLGIPEKWVNIAPSDGLPNSAPDEEKLNISYAHLDRYLRTGIIEDLDEKERIESRHTHLNFKIFKVNVPYFDPNLPRKIGI